MSDIKIDLQLTDRPKEKLQDESKLGFGQIFSDHMLLVDYTDGKGWHSARIVPFQNLCLSPACSVFHYGSEIFEGLKAYRTEAGKIQLFRPLENIRRMNNSAKRLCLPQMPEQDMLAYLKKFVEVEKDWTPKTQGSSLYLRPFMIGVEPTLLIREVKDVMFCIIASPSGSYYSQGIDPVKILIEPEDVRAVVGGTGAAKCGGNYAGSIRAGRKAALMGCDQVLWLDGIERKYIEEAGAMNVMFKIDGTVVTPSLSGSVLPGVTRKSCIQLLKDNEIPVEERQISVDELISAQKSGKLEEAWGTGTAAVVVPIGQLVYNDEKFTINNLETGETTQLLYDQLTGIQRGKIKDTHNWIVPIR